MRRVLSRGGLALAACAAAAGVFSGPGTRLGLWGFRTGFSVLKAGAYAGLAAAAVSLAGLLMGLSRKGDGRPFAALGLGVGLAVFAVPWSLLRLAKSLPAIHDITTDAEDPPAFVKILALRRDAPNRADYGGPLVAALQRSAYPDLGPLELAIPRERAFEKALEAARAMGWRVVDADAEAGRIEATATTFWFGFKDDVVVRLAAPMTGSRVDVRSVSRVGKGDVGTNARRLRDYLKLLERLTR